LLPDDELDPLERPPPLEVEAVRLLPDEPLLDDSPSDWLLPAEELPEDRLPD